jgi:hypothetical protein
MDTINILLLIFSILYIFFIIILFMNQNKNQHL